MRHSAIISILFYFLLFGKVQSTVYVCDSSSSCGCSKISNVSINARIVGGEIVQQRSWPWMISLQNNNRHRCGASLIQTNIAVTAAHCIDDSLTDFSKLSIIAGVNQLSNSNSPTMQRRQITEIVMHPNFNSQTFENDIALLRFSPLVINDQSSIGFVCLPTLDNDPFQIGEKLVATGWGLTDENSLFSSDVLRQVTVEAISPTASSCISNTNFNSALMVCAGLEEGGKDTCQGDSGGPLLAFNRNRWTLAGITSFGEGCARPKYPGVYTRVSRFINFIEYHTNSVNSTTVSTSTIKATESQSSSVFTPVSSTVAVSTTFPPIHSHVDHLYSSIFTSIFVLITIWIL